MSVDIASAAESAAPGLASAKQRQYDLWITPTVLTLLVLLLGAVWVYSDFDETTERILETSSLLRQARQHIGITLWSTIAVVGIAIPAGIIITRPKYKRFAAPVLGIANSGQAIPAYGLIVLFFAFLGQGTGLLVGGTTTMIAALTMFGLLPVLRNTMVGIEQVDRSVIEAGRGMGMSRRQALLQIELPLAVSVILAGVRTALVINVGMAALGFLIGAGGLGETINSGLKLQRNGAIFVGASLVAILALFIDWIAALAERYLRPKGI